MAYNCWAAPILWQSAYLWSPDLPNPGVKTWVALTVSPGVPVKAGKTYRITCYCIIHPSWGAWEWWDGDEWIKDQAIAAIRCWSDTENNYTRGSFAAGCNYYASSGSWSYSNDLTFRVYDSEGIQDSQEAATVNTGFFQLHSAGSQTFTPLENYTAVKIELMLNEHETIRRGYFIVKIERVTMGDPGFGWVEGTKLAYIDNDGLKRTQEGTDTGDNGTEEDIWVDGTYQYYVDASGDVRRIEGTLTGLTGKLASQISINTKAPMSGTHYCYIDDTGAERCFEGSLA